MMEETIKEWGNLDPPPSVPSRRNTLTVRDRNNTRPEPVTCFEKDVYMTSLEVPRNCTYCD